MNDALLTNNKPAKSFLNRLLKIDRVLLFTVIIPTFIAIIYYGFIASDIYVSESRFIIRSPQKQSQSSLLGSFLQSGGFNRSPDDTYSVHDYILSRDALANLNQQMGIIKLYSNPNIDFINRFPRLGSDDSFESFYKYYQSLIVNIDYDSSSAITTLKIQAFSAQDAQRINQLLLAMGENLINKLNQRASQDMIRFAGNEVAIAEKQLKTASIALSRFRNKQAVFDPERQSTLQLTQVAKLQDDLITSQTQLAQIIALAPHNAQIPVLRTRIQVLQAAINNETGKVAGGSTSLSNKSVDYERLVLDRDLADKQLASTMASLETARNEAQRQQLYLERLIQPNLPDVAIEPRRLRAIAAVFGLGLVFWGIFSILIAGVREHHD